jgi:hypothetical protein
VFTNLPERIFTEIFGLDLGGPSGRFEVQNGLVTPINDEGVKFVAPMSESDFVAAIQNA